MTDYPNITFLDVNQDVGPMKTGWFGPIRDFALEQPGGAAEQSLTISSGAVTPAAGASRSLVIDTESSAATDDLDNIVLTNWPVGAVGIIRSTNAARVPTWKHGSGGSGQILLRDGVDYAADDPDKRVAVQRIGSDLVEIWRSGDEDLRAEITTTSGTVHTFSSISANVTQVIYSFRGISHSGGGSPTLRLRAGDGTIKTSGYNVGSGSGTEIPLGTAVGAASPVYGLVTLQLMDRTNNRWLALAAGRTGGDALGVEFTLTNPLSDLQLDWSGGETFDAGSVGLHAR